jgi:hypothetical protein
VMTSVKLASGYWGNAIGKFSGNTTASAFKPEFGTTVSGVGVGVGVGVGFGVGDVVA